MIAPCRKRKALLTILAVALANCSRPIQTARLSDAEPESSSEAEARYRGEACSPYWSLAFPGLGQACNRQVGKAALLGVLGATELAGGIVGGLTNKNALGENDFSHPSSEFPLLAFQNTYFYSVSDAVMQRQLRQGLRYVPTDSTLDLVAAPFNIQVMKRPEVWAGLLGFLAIGVGASLLLAGDNVDRDEIGGGPNLFGRQFSQLAGYGLGAGLGTTRFSHVAISEEALFRGVAQSGWSRKWGETQGWLAASALFGAAHAPNALALDGKDRLKYLLVGLPVITAGGAYIGWVYRRDGYSLAPPVAIHFWYDLLLSTTFMVLDPKNNAFSAKIGFQF